jgi:hypothetical protein
MSSADFVLAVFGLCNSLWIVAYASQMLVIAWDTGGATGVSYTAWSVFALSNLSTVAYAILSLDDWRMAAFFSANATCCAAILILTALRRRASVPARLGHGLPGQ